MDSNFALFCLRRFLNPSKRLMSEDALEVAEADFAFSSLDAVEMYLPLAMGLAGEGHPTRPAVIPGRFRPRAILAARWHGL